MGEFASMEEDWGLEAIVRGFTDNHSPTMSSSFDDFFFDFPRHLKSDDNNEDTLLSFSEFDQAYKPVFDDSFSSQASIGSSTNTNTSSSSSSNDKAFKLESAEEMKMKKSPKSSTIHAVKYKKRKNQHKRVVLQPEGHSSDTWAWRKYGQKPIKGSPYPRSYYKCSSSKGCLARKQVEQSSTDPGTFIITYSAEHNHSQPTRRSSLAGTNRPKFTAHKSSSTVQDSSVTIPRDTSPTTPLRSSNVEEVIMFQQPIKNKKNVDLVIDEKSGSEIDNENECNVSDVMVLEDDFFVGLEDLDRLISESGFYSFPYQTIFGNM